MSEQEATIIGEIETDLAEDPHALRMFRLLTAEMPGRNPSSPLVRRDNAIAVETESIRVARLAANAMGKK